MWNLHLSGKQHFSMLMLCRKSKNVAICGFFKEYIGSGSKLKSSSEPKEIPDYSDSKSVKECNLFPSISNDEDSLKKRQNY